MNRLFPCTQSTSRPLPSLDFLFRNSYLVYIAAAIIVLLPSMLSAQSLRLEESIERAMTHNPGILNAEARIRIAHGQMLQAISPAPLSVGYHEEDIAQSDGIGDGGQRIYTVSQDFDIPLLLGSRGYVYGSLTDAAEVQYDYAKRSVRAEIVSAYAYLFAREKQYTLSRNNAVLAKRFADAAQQRYEAGETSRLEYLQAKSRLALAQQEARTAKSELLSAERTLIAAIGDTTLTSVLAKDSLSPPATRLTIDMDFEQLIDRHPLARAAYHEYQGYRSDRNWRWMEYLPSFSASAFRQEYKDIGNYWGIELTAHLPIWLLLSPRGTNEEAGGYAMEAEARYTAARIQAKTRIRTVLERMETAQDNLSGYTASLMSEAQEIRRTADRSIAEGEIGYLEYVSAIESANRILMGYYDALAEFYTAASSFQAETGIDIQW